MQEICIQTYITSTGSQRMHRTRRGPMTIPLMTERRQTSQRMPESFQVRLMNLGQATASLALSSLPIKPFLHPQALLTTVKILKKTAIMQRSTPKRFVLEKFTKVQQNVKLLHWATGPYFLTCFHLLCLLPTVHQRQSWSYTFHIHCSV